MMENTRRFISRLFLVIMLTNNAYSQEKGLVEMLSKQIKKNNRKLSTEINTVKKIPGKTFTYQVYEGSDSLSCYFPERMVMADLYISAFEVSNKQYREFVEYVKDSIARNLLGYFLKNSKTQRLDFSRPIDWKNDRILEYLNPLLLAPDERIFGRKEIDPEKLVYRYRYENQFVECPVTPDTLCWIRDYAYSYNEPMTHRYFRHPAFNDYPVQGISYFQAQAYCNWKTNQIRNYLPANFEYTLTVSLPTAMEWESAASDAVSTGTLQKGAQKTGENSGSLFHTLDLNRPLKKTKKGYTGYDCNFFSIRDENGYTLKAPAEDGAFYTAPVNAYGPNKNGIYNMRGNVAEWTSTDGDECYRNMKDVFISKKEPDTEFIEKMRLENPTLVPLKTDFTKFLLTMKNLKIVKGGAWDSNAFYIQPGVHRFLHPMDRNSGTGFRYKISFEKNN